MEVTVTTKRQRLNGLWSTWQLVLPFVVLGAIGMLFEIRILAYVGFGIAVLLGIVAVDEIVRRLRPKSHCPKCSAELRGRSAKQCFACGHNWREAIP